MCANWKKKLAHMCFRERERSFPWDLKKINNFEANLLIGLHQCASLRKRSHRTLDCNTDCKSAGECPTRSSLYFGWTDVRWVGAL